MGITIVQFVLLIITHPDEVNNVLKKENAIYLVIFYNGRQTFDMTIIKVKYIEYLSNGDDALEATSVDREMLVNVNCPIKMILNYIRKVARVIGEFDLCDEVNCQLKNISLYEPCTRGTDIFQSYLTYFIVTFERDENGQMINLTPLLTGKAAKKYCDILSKIQKPSRKTSIKSALKKHNNVQ